MAGTPSLASLSPTLLVRKGRARPAMRRQDGSIDDLGCNDFGAEDGALPEVLRQIERTAIRLVLPARRSLRLVRSTKGRRAAFTLRLDTDRHQRLRHAGALLGRSGQSVVTEALDQYLSGLGEGPASDPTTHTSGERGHVSRAQGE